jgi:hypothetical protein
MLLLNFPPLYEREGFAVAGIRRGMREAVRRQLGQKVVANYIKTPGKMIDIPDQRCQLESFQRVCSRHSRMQSQARGAQKRIRIP